MVQKSEDEWKQRLTPDQYRVLRQKGTEAPFTGDLIYNKATGMYACAACGQALFSSDTKFESGSGWPSFYDVSNSQAVKLQADTSQGMHRVEVMCAACDSHLGHVFNDAPNQPTGMRFCINSCALSFQPESSAKSGKVKKTAKSSKS